MTERNEDLREKLRMQGRILGAVLLQDMRTRFGTASYFGYLISIAWPLGHIAVIMGAYLLVNSIAPVGEDPAVFVATGLLPYVLCLYPARQLGMTIMQNQQLLNIPVLRPVHLIVARLLIELATAALVCLLFYIVVEAVGIDVWPKDLVNAAGAISACLYLAVGFGFLNVVLVSLLGHFALMGFILLMVGLYVTSGVYIPVNMVPEPLRSLMAYNPLANLVEWMRSAYFASYDVDLINKKLVIGTASVALLLGLLGERFMRNKLMG